MSQISELKASVEEILNALHRLGPNRVVALSTHKTKALIAEIEGHARQVAKQLDAME
jgi:hypothetical protein|tara:strand:+ start:1121 stop:1291 length:171 start_codon:yes stop_codon:yes gene_type:complete